MFVSVFHQNFHFLDGVGGGKSLFGADFVESEEHGGIDGAGDVEERSGYALHAHDAVFFKFWYGSDVGRLLDFGDIRRCDPFLGIMLGVFEDGVLEALQGFSDGVGNGDVKVKIFSVLERLMSQTKLA